MSETQAELRRIHEDAAQIIRMAGEMTTGHTSKLNAIALVAERIQTRALSALRSPQVRDESGNVQGGRD